MVPVKPSNCPELVPLKLTPPARFSTLAELPEYSFPEKPLASAPEEIVPVVFAGTVREPPKKTDPLAGKASVAPLLMDNAPLPSAPATPGARLPP